LKTIELRSLLDGTNKEIDIPKDIEKAFDIWLKVKKKKSDISKLKLLEIFYAGYVLSNPIVREKYIQSDIINK